MKGIENVPEGPVIIAPNHVSFYDPPVIAAVIPEEVHFLARETLFNSPVLGRLLRNLNSYPVSGTHQDLTSFKILCKLLEEKKKVTLFPEGERSPDGTLQPIKSGIGMLAQRCQVPIVPAYIDGAYEVWSRNRRFPKFFGRITCTFGKPIYPSEFAHLPKKEAQAAMAQKVWEEINALVSLSNR